MRLFLAGQVAYFKIPQRILLVSETPKGTTGKPVRIGLAHRLGLDARPGPGKPGACGEVKAPYDELITTLAAAWEGVLGTGPVGDMDNFFLLGGNSVKAAELLARVNGVYRTQLPIETLFRYPTVDGMARVLRDGHVSDRRIVVPLKESGSGAPLFCIHTISLELFSYLEIAKAIGPGHPVYGIQPVGLDGDRKPLDRIEEMAALYIDEIRKVQPRGPYHLLGYSGAGTIAYEMAVQLTGAGEEVAFTGIVDNPAPGSTYGDFRKTLDARFLHVAASQMPHMVARFVDMPLHEKSAQINYVLAGLKIHARRAAGSARKLAGRRQADKVLPVPESVIQSIKDFQSPKREIFVGLLLGFHTYRPKKLKGNIVLFFTRPRNFSYLYNLYDPSMGWEDLVDGRVEVVPVPGDHTTCILLPHAAVLAEKLVEYVGQAGDRPPMPAVPAR